MMRRIIGCMAAFLCLLGTTFPLPAAELGTAVQKNREVVARDYAASDTKPVAVRIALRAVGTKDPAAWKAGDKVEVVARLTSGDEVVIDEVEGGEVIARSVIVDAEGSVVGFFRTWTTQEDIWTSARGAFAIYLAGPKGVFRRTGEVKCKKVAREGKPMVAFANARWRGDTRELEVNVRASCESVDFFGSAEQRRFLTLSILGYSGKEGAYTEEEGRILVSFSEDGEVLGANVLKGSSEEVRAIRTCEAEGRKGGPFRVCGPNSDSDVTAYWSHGGAPVEHGFACTADKSTIASGPTYRAHSCDGLKDEDEKEAWIRIEIAHADMPRAVDLRLTCQTCTRFSARRLAFDATTRTVSFNLDADARALTFEGESFEVPVPAAQTAEGRTSLTVPVIAVRLNAQWQIVELSAITAELSEQARRTPP